MSDSSLVRFSRDGDQFHYLWAARQCLRLLLPGSDLVALSIEGASIVESGNGDSVEDGEQIIDVAEYYGSENIKAASKVKYCQLKHSTQASNQPWTQSGLAKTLKGFSERYQALVQKFGAEHCGRVLSFWFVTNRPIADNILETISDLSLGVLPRHQGEVEKLKTHTGLDGDGLAKFCRLLHLEGGLQGYQEQRIELGREFGAYLPGDDVDAPVQLKELVNRKALSESAENPTITKIDVLRVLKTDESRLFPAPCLIEAPEKIILREQESEIVPQIIGAGNVPIIIHADGGVGKSIFITRIQNGLPIGSLSILYDCFGNGQYRNVSSLRHRHKDALVQIANELASRGLCHPLIPSGNADAGDYLRAFKHRLSQSVEVLKAEHSEALLCIVIDAADNAQMEALELSEARSFVIDLLREDLPDGVRLIATCRTHRQYLLEPPANALPIKLRPFSRAETEIFLHQKFPDATTYDVDEFHRLSSANPRVQATALSWEQNLSQTLRALGPNPTSAEDTISDLLDQAIVRLKDKAGAVERGQIDLMCAGLAALRPRVPIGVLAAISNVPEPAIRSFAIDLGRPLLLAGDAVQFFDEPSETWFRERFKPVSQDFSKFIEILKPLASSSSYVAAVLPQLMLEAGQFSELVELALSSEGLPEGSPLEQRDIELQRLQFAVKASLRAKRYADAAKLALKAGGETAAEDRQYSLVQENTDLAGLFMEPNLIEEVVSRRAFSGGWLGAHHAYEAGLLSVRNELKGEARSRLRMAHEWLRSWSQLEDEERKREQIHDMDIAEIGMAHLNIHGAQQAADNLCSWRPCDVSFRAGRIVASRLVDHERYRELDELALAAGNDLGLILAITKVLMEVHRTPPISVVKRALRLLQSPKVKLSRGHDFDHEETILSAVTALVIAGRRHRLYEKEVLASVLSKYLPDSPPHGLQSRISDSRSVFLRAYALRAGLLNAPLRLNDLAHPDLRKVLEDKASHRTIGEAQEFEESVGALLPWHQLWVRAFLHEVTSEKMAEEIKETKAVSSKAANIRYREESYTSDEIARIWFDVLVIAGDDEQKEDLGEFDRWVESLRRPLFIPTLTSLARVAARQDRMCSKAFTFANSAAKLAEEDRDDADSKVASFVGLSRAIWAVSKGEAKAYFNKAVEVSNRIGRENLDRWAAILYLADRAADPQKPSPLMAYKLSRCAELTYDYVVRDKHFDWSGTVESIAALCPASCLTILSRWRDRKFGWEGRLLPQAIEFVTKDRGCNALAQMALLGLRYEWNLPWLLDAALNACLDQAEKERVLSYFLRYVRLDQHGLATWISLQNISSFHKLIIPQIDDLISVCRQEEEARKSKETWRREKSAAAASDEREKKDWETIFSEVDLTRSEGVSLAYRRFRSTEAPYNTKSFFIEVVRRLELGCEDKFIRALPEVAEFDLYEFRGFLDTLPNDWKKRLAVKEALRDVLKLYCRRHCMEISKSRYFEVLPIDKACELSGVSEEEVAGVVLTALGETTDELRSGRLFTLTSLLALKMQPSEALDVLDYGLGLLSAFLNESDGDGDWSEELAPPESLESAIAGYVWSALAAPEASMRWQAAHVVRGLCHLKRQKVIDEIVVLAKAKKAGPFSDANLHFYDFHALQWLLIGLARAAQESPDSVRPHADWLVSVALEGPPHVMLRKFAADTVLSLIEGGCLSVDEDILNALRAVNVNRFAQAESDGSQAKVVSGEGEEDSEPGESGFYFGLDMEPYWFSPLGRRFSISAVDIGKMVRKVIVEEWGIKSGSWEADVRGRRRLYPERETLHSHGSYPRTDDRQFYLVYHAMMVVAGRLLDTRPLHRDPYEVDGFEEWIQRHDLTRGDGRWLFDRRDPQPLKEPTSWQESDISEEWPWSVALNDFDVVLGLGGHQLNLWGRWTDVSGEREESISISSALVSSSTSMALLRALQTVKNPYDYRIPEAGGESDFEIESGDYQLRGWIADRCASKGIDEFDPWSGDIEYPPLSPARFIQEQFKLTADVERRNWRRVEEGSEANILSCEVWGDIRDGEDGSERERGRRIHGDRKFVSEVLSQLEMDLILEVQIRRSFTRSRYGRTRDSGLDYVAPYTRIYVIRRDGSVCTL